jgi:hypothetical protein
VVATHYADAVFAILPHLKSTKALYDVIKRSAVEAGRSLFRVQPIRRRLVRRSSRHAGRA